MHSMNGFLQSFEHETKTGRAAILTWEQGVLDGTPFTRIVLQCLNGRMSILYGMTLALRIFSTKTTIKSQI